MDDGTRRWRRIADRAAAVAAVAAVVAFVAIFALAGGEHAGLGRVVVAACILVAFVAQGVFFWAFVRGRLYRPRDRAPGRGPGPDPDRDPGR